MAQGLEEIISQTNCRKARFEERSLQFIEIWIYEGFTEPLSFEGTLTPSSDLGKWLRKKDTLPHVTAERDRCEHRLQGALKLLYQEWSIKELKRMMDENVIPFTRDGLRVLLDKLQVPHSYIDDMVTGDSSLRIEATEQIRSMICQTPQLSEKFMTMALGYDADSKITTGYLGYVNNPSGATSMRDMLENLRSAKTRASHPSLLPTLTLQIWTVILRQGIDKNQDFLRRVQDQIEEMQKEAETSERMDTIPTRSLVKLHKRLVDVQHLLTGAIPDFVYEFSRSLTDDAGELRISGRASSDCSRWDAEIKSCISHLQGVTKRQMGWRDRLLSRHESQLKALYTLMQQRDSFMNYEIAVAAKADSSAMKIISVVTMVFLPPTAVATIFSMSPFFSVSEDLLVVNVSPKFWLYWAVTIPLTMVVLLVWGCWLKWDDFILPLLQERIVSRLAQEQRSSHGSTV